jgi:uncharacterized membrane protein YccC
LPCLQGWESAFRDTLKRGVQRIFGALAGAGGATLAVALLRPSDWVTASRVAAADRVIGALAGGIVALLVHAGWSASERARIRKGRT